MQQRPLTLLVAAASLALSAAQSTWSCTTLNTSTLVQGVVWTRANCTSPDVPFWGRMGPLIVNMVAADLRLPSIRLSPLVANATAQLQPLNAIARNNASLNVQAGINGGYFYRVDVGSFIDGVCQGKTKADAEAPVSKSTPNTGVGDCATVISGAALSSNCDEPGYSRPAVLTINGTSSYVSVLHRGDVPPAGLTLDSLSAGPNLVTTNASGTFVDIPSDDDNIGNILEHAANTGVGFAANGTAYLVAFDGADSCFFADPTCGTNCFTMVGGSWRWCVFCCICCCHYQYR